jgi:hypothetical protein
MSNNQTETQTTQAMPPMQVNAFPPGTTSINKAAALNQQQNINNQVNLTKLSGGRKRRMRGGQNGVASTTSSVTVVPSPPSYAVNPDATQTNFTDLTKLNETAYRNAQYDSAATKSDTAAIAATNNQNAGGWKKTRGWKKKGGSWTHWGCLSGGKKHRRKTKRTKRTKRTNKHRKTKRHHR